MRRVDAVRRRIESGQIDALMARAERGLVQNATWKNPDGASGFRSCGTIDATAHVGDTKRRIAGPKA